MYSSVRELIKIAHIACKTLKVNGKKVIIQHSDMIKEYKYPLIVSFQRKQSLYSSLVALEYI